MIWTSTIWVSWTIRVNHGNHQGVFRNVFKKGSCKNRIWKQLQHQQVLQNLEGGLKQQGQQIQVTGHLSVTNLWIQVWDFKKYTIPFDRFDVDFLRYMLLNMPKTYMDPKGLTAEDHCLPSTCFFASDGGRVETDLLGQSHNLRFLNFQWQRRLQDVCVCDTVLQYLHI